MICKLFENKERQLEIRDKKWPNFNSKLKFNSKYSQPYINNKMSQKLKKTDNKPSQINSSEDEYEHEYEEEDNIDEDDLVTLNLKSTNIQLKYSQLWKYSRLISKKYLFDDVKERLSDEINEFEISNHIKEDNLIYFLKLFNDEKIQITNDRYKDFLKISEFLQVNSFIKKLNNYKKRHFKDIDFIIQNILEELSNRTNFSTFESDFEFQMEKCLINHIDECIKNEKYSSLQWNN